jgi:hypothetical protein
VRFDEKCDGAPSMSCQEAGYFGGTSACSGECELDTRPCDPCAPGTAACLVALIDRVTSVAPSGTRLALGDGRFISIFDGSSIVTTVPLENVGIVAVSNGWLVNTAAPRALVPMASDGTLGTAQPGSFAFGMAFAANRVLVTKFVDEKPYAEIRDETGALVVPAFSLPAEWQPPVWVTSNATSFFTGQGGTLLRITLDGTQTIVTGFPAGFRVVWAGTGGWYVGRSGSSEVLQRFDETGARVGTPFTVELGNAFDYIGDGDDLLVLRYVSDLPRSRLEIMRVDTSGVVGTPKPVAVTDRFGTPDSYSPIARLGNDLVVSWQDHDQTWVARIAPPQ